MLMINIGKSFSFGLNISAIVIDMNSLLGNCIGNSLEIEQAIDILKIKKKIYLSCLYISALTGNLFMVLNVKKIFSLKETQDLAQKQIDNGKTLEKFTDIDTRSVGIAKMLTGVGKEKR
jgi:thymidine phosphorylase